MFPLLFLSTLLVLNPVWSVPLQEVSARSYNGITATSAAQFPYQARLELNGGLIVCSGAIIAENWIVTAAFCLTEATSGTVTVGTRNLQVPDPNRRTVPIVRIVYHAGYNPNQNQNNIGLVQTPVLPITSTIRPINLPRDNLGDGVSVTVSGWVSTSIGKRTLRLGGILLRFTPSSISYFLASTTYSTILQYAPLLTVSNSLCALTCGNRITNQIVCAVSLDITRNIYCWGDFGAPLVTHASDGTPVLEGIGNFFSPNGCSTDAPSGFTRIAPYVPWINGLIN